MHKNNHQGEKLVLQQCGINRTMQIHHSCVIICHIQIFFNKVMQRMYTGKTSALCLAFPSCNTLVNSGSSNKIKFCWGQCHAVNWHPLDRGTDPCSLSVYYCNISCFQSLITSHVYMTLGLRQLSMFASKLKKVAQIRIQISHVEAVLERWSLPIWQCYQRLVMLN